MAAKCSFLSLCKLKNLELHLKNQNDDHNTHFKNQIGIYYLKNTTFILHNLTITSQSTHFNSTKSPNVTAASFNCKECPNKPNKIPPLLYFYFYKQGFFPPPKSPNLSQQQQPFTYMYTNLTSLHSCLQIQSGDHGW